METLELFTERDIDTHAVSTAAADECSLCFGRGKFYRVAGYPHVRHCGDPSPGHRKDGIEKVWFCERCGGSGTIPHASEEARKAA